MDNIIPYIEELVLNLGISKFLDSLQSNISTVCKECGIENSDEKLREFIRKQGIISFLRNYNNPDLFRIYSEGLNLNEEQEPSVSGLEDILDEIVLQGMHSWLEKFPKPLLESWCNDLQIERNDRSNLVDKIMTKIFQLQQLEDDVNNSIIPISTSTTEMVETTKKERNHHDKKSTKHRSGSDLHESGDKRKKKVPRKRRTAEDSKEEADGKKEQKPKRRKGESSDEEQGSGGEKNERHGKKRKSDDEEDSGSLRKSKSIRVKKAPPTSQIKYGISSSELNKYTLANLTQYCKEQNISYAGKKEQIIRRILLHLSDDDESDQENKGKEREKDKEKAPKKQK
jgi:hypothetical protein